LRNCFSESPWKGSGRLVEYQTPLTSPFNATTTTIFSLMNSTVRKLHT